MSQPWQNALERHNENEYAHAAERHQQNNDWFQRMAIMEADINNLAIRISKQETWRTWMMGGIAVLAFEVTIAAGFVIAIWLHTNS